MKRNTVKLTRIAAAVTSAAIAPAVLLSSPAFAAEASDAATGSGKGSVSTRDQAEEDRVAIFRILAEPGIGSVLKEYANHVLDSDDPAALRSFLEEGQYIARDQDNCIFIAGILDKAGPSVAKAGRAALHGTPEDRVAFLKTGQYEARAIDNRVLATQIYNAGGPSVREAAKKALMGTPEDVQRFLDTGQYEARRTDNEVLVSKIINKGGPEVRKAGKKALVGTDEELEQFLKVGQYEARKKDEANEAANKDKDKPSPKPKPEPGKDGKPDTGKDGAGHPAKDSETGGSGTTAVPAGDVKPQGTTGGLAATGAPGALPWAATGTGLALAAGVGMVVVA
ncbi:ALF repeat-containing protein, partial [Streptomyces sp. NPDC001941]|uniref:ALF repeat-containing protein n=1 Tax=Streptomyces sp. NPDC001941 TaxID=3154659 RepID=UPI003324F26A